MGFFSRLFGKERPQGASEAESRITDIEPYRRTAWLPELQDGDGTVTTSKFSGIPYLAEDETWPECPNCGNPLQLFLQLSSDNLPIDAGKPWGEGLLQFFYCTNLDPSCEVDCAAWGPFAKSTQLRVVETKEAPSKYENSPVLDPFPPKVITGWTAVDDLPNWEEQESLGIYLSSEDSDRIGEDYPRAGEKLLGWPCWVQGVEYPNCPQCDSVMRLVFQIDSDGALPYMLGDVGIGHISQCPNHPTTLAFGWACS